MEMEVVRLEEKIICRLRTITCTLLLQKLSYFQANNNNAPSTPTQRSSSTIFFLLPDRIGTIILFGGNLAMMKMLVADGERASSSAVQDWFSQQRYFVDVVHNGLDASMELRQKAYDVIVLGLDLPGIDGHELCRRFRESGGTAPVLVMTDQESSEERQLVLEAGADDYVGKPLVLSELTSRVRALLRRTMNMNTLPNVLRVGDLVLIPEASTAAKNGRELHLTPIEFNLLELFMRHPNKVFSPEALWQRIWPGTSVSYADTVRTHIKTLRKKLDDPDKPSAIKNVRGRGYKLEDASRLLH
jgi:DNA-binding response OmpR family regulator